MRCYGNNSKQNQSLLREAEIGENDHLSLEAITKTVTSFRREASSPFDRRRGRNAEWVRGAVLAKKARGGS
jgi:hypothetical protein